MFSMVVLTLADVYNKNIFFIYLKTAIAELNFSPKKIHGYAVATLQIYWIVCRLFFSLNSESTE